MTEPLKTSELAKSFEPKEIEARWYPIWEQRGYFRAGSNPSKPGYSIQLPPPNITGILHMGHAFNQSVMDALTRFHRMDGDNTLWLPGTDHAGIATQIVVERRLESERLDRRQIGRDAFIRRVWDWQKFSGGTILKQMRRIGDSVDWDRLYFTMDSKLAPVVREVFIRLYRQGLIYRGKRLVNWDPKLQTAVSDLEVEDQEVDGFFWKIRYPAADGGPGICVETTRPETLFGDVCVAVNAADPRYQDMIGKDLILPLMNKPIPVIADEHAQPEFGTGAVKITPAHDPNDFQVGLRHGFEPICVMTKTARMNDVVPEKYRGMDRYEARDAVVEDLKALGLLEGIRPCRHMVPRVTRTGEIVEPMISSQWYVAMSKPAPEGSLQPGKSIAQVGLEAVQNGEVNIFPEQWRGVYCHWLENIQDWCISRQLWWGHQIPAWYDEAGNIYVAHDEAEAQAQAGEGVRLTRDEDVLDTWFSSALVPFSTLGWPDPKGDDTLAYDLYLPSSVLVTGYDIIFFWVARMVMMTKHFTGRVPFHDVYIHGLVRDKDGKKMSKSEGNTLDPLDIIDGIDLESLVKKNTMGLRRPETAPQVAKAIRRNYPDGIKAHGADALRFTMCAYATLGRNVNFDLARCEGYHNFCNKLWNATRFALMNVQGQDCGLAPGAEMDFGTIDRWITSLLQRTVAEVRDAYRDYRLDNAANAIYAFVWNEFCDWYLELAKVRLATGTEAERRATRHTLVTALETVLRLAHPIIPFITEELWQKVSLVAGTRAEDEETSVMVQAYPRADSARLDEKAEAAVATVKEMVEAVRNLRTQMKLAPSDRVPLAVEGDAATVAAAAPYLKQLARLADVRHSDSLDKEPSAGLAPVAILHGFKLMLAIEIDVAAETARLTKQADKLAGDIARTRGKLANEKFVSRAPKAVVDQERERLAKFEALLAATREQLAKFAGR